MIINLLDTFVGVGNVEEPTVAVPVEREPTDI